MHQERTEEGGLLLILWSFFSLCMTGFSILFYTKMHRHLFRLFRVFLLWPITFFIVQFSVFVLCVNEVLRFFVSLLLRIKYRGKAALVKDGADSVWAFKGKGSTRMILIPVILSQKAILFEHSIATELEKRLFEGGKENSIYRKLKSVIFSFCGYIAMREVNDFNARNHVRTLRRNEVYSEEDVTQLLSEFCHDMDLTKPQWEILIIRRFLDATDGVEKSVLIFRFHHSYMDGMSLLMMLNKLSDDHHYKLNPLTSGLPSWKMALHYANVLIFGSLEFYHIVLNRLRKFWKTNSDIPLGQQNFAWSRDKFSFESLQKIRNESKASISNILGLSFVESCRRILPEDRLVRSISIGETMGLLPYPNTKPQNRFTIFSYGADISSEFICAFSLNERLKALKEEAQDSIMGPQPLIDYYLFKLIGRLPTILFPIFLSGTQDSVYLSGVPCARDKFTLFQGECHALGAFSPCFTETGLMLGVLTYGKWVSVSIGAEESWLSKDEIHLILDTMVKVVDELLQAAVPVHTKSVAKQQVTKPKEPMVEHKEEVEVHDAPTLPNVPEEVDEETKEHEDVKATVSDSSDHVDTSGVHSQESLTDSHKEDENQNSNQNQNKKKKVRSRNKTKSESKVTK